MYGEGVSVYKSKDSDWKPIVDGLGMHLDIDNINGKRYYYIRNKGTNIEEFDLKKATRDQYQLKIVIDIESGKLENIDFGNQIEQPITIEKITEIQKSINVVVNGSYGRIAPIRDISTILSLVKEDIDTIQQDKTCSATVEKINKSGIRFLCFTEDGNSSPETKRNILTNIMQKALDDGSIKVVSVMYSLRSTDNVKRHSIVVMGCNKKDGYNNNLDVKIFDSNGGDYNNGSYSDFKNCTDITLLNTEDEHVQSGSNCSYWSEGDLIVVFRKHLQEKGIKKELLTNQEKWNTEVLGEIICVVGYNNTKTFTNNYKAITGVNEEEAINVIKSSSENCLMKTIVGERVKIQSTKTQGINHKKEDLKENEVKQANFPNISLPQQNILLNIPTPPPPSPNMSIPKPSQVSSGNEEGTLEEKAIKDQAKKQMQNVFSELLGKVKVLNISSTSSPQQTQSNTLQAPLKRPTVPRSKSSPLP